MARKVQNIKVYSPLKLHQDLTGKCHAICHYSYNLPLGHMQFGFSISIGLLQIGK